MRLTVALDATVQPDGGGGVDPDTESKEVRGRQTGST